jgi:hypothetical protein
VPSCVFLIGPRNKKSTKKRFSRKNYSSTVLNYELTFVMKMITKAPPTPPPAFRPPFDWAPIDQNTRLGTWKLGRVSSLFFEALYDEFHKKCERVIGNGGRIIFSAKSFFRAFFIARVNQKNAAWHSAARVLTRHSFNRMRAFECVTILKKTKKRMGSATFARGMFSLVTGRSSLWQNTPVMRGSIL